LFRAFFWAFGVYLNYSEFGLSLSAMHIQVIGGNVLFSETCGRLTTQRLD